MEESFLGQEKLKLNMSGRETSASLLPPRPQKSFPLSWTAATAIFHFENSSFSVRIFDFNLPLPPSLTAVGLFLLGCSKRIVWIAVNPWKKSSVSKPRNNYFRDVATVWILTDNISDLPRSTFLQLGENVGLERQRGNSKEKLSHVFPCRVKGTHSASVRACMKTAAAGFQTKCTNQCQQSRHVWQMMMWCSSDHELCNLAFPFMSVSSGLHREDISWLFLTWLHVKLFVTREKIYFS